MNLTLNGKNNQGFTLIEVMIAISIITGVSLGLYNVHVGMVRSALHHENMTKLQDDARTSLQTMTRMLRMASNGTVMYLDTSTSTYATLGTVARSNIRFQMVADIDGNGNSLDDDFELELTNFIRFTADTADANSDGRSATQLVQLDQNGNVTRILTNYLASGGLTFVRTNGGVQISIQLERKGQGAAPLARFRLDEVVAIRN